MCFLVLMKIWDICDYWALVSLRVFESHLRLFSKSFLNENFIIEMKSEKALKTTLFHWVTVSKPLGQNWIMRYLWEDNIQIFHLTPSGPIYPQYFCHKGHFYKLRPIKKWENLELFVHILSRPCVWSRGVGVFLTVYNKLRIRTSFLNKNLDKKR